MNIPINLLQDVMMWQIMRPVIGIYHIPLCIVSLVFKVMIEEVSSDTISEEDEDCYDKFVFLEYIKAHIHSNIH